MFMSHTPASHRVSCPHLAPTVTVFARDERTLVRKCANLAAPGVYVLIGRNDDEEHPTVYVGQGRNVGERMLASAAGRPHAELLVAVTESEGLLTATGAALVERFAYASFKQAGAIIENAGMTYGARVDDAEYAVLRHFWNDAARLIAKAGLVLDRLSADELDRGPPPPDIDTVSPVVRGTELLQNQGPEFHAFGFPTAGGRFAILAGSRIAGVTSDLARCTPLMRRLDLLHYGLLSPDGTSLLLTRDITLDSRRAAVLLVRGSHVDNGETWRPVRQSSPEPEARP